MNSHDLFNYLRIAFPKKWVVIQKKFEDNRIFFGEVFHIIIKSLTMDLVQKIFKSDCTYDIDSETSIIRIIMSTGIHQEIVFRFFHVFLSSMNVKDCQKPFKEWYMSHSFNELELSTQICFPRVQIHYNQDEATARGVIIEMQNPPILKLSPSIGVHQITHGNIILTTFKKYYAKLILSIKIKILKPTEMLKALCIGVYDKQNIIVNVGRICQWQDNTSDFEISVIFDCEVENILNKMQKVYFYWEGSKKDYTYLKRHGYGQYI